MQQELYNLFGKKDFPLQPFKYQPRIGCWSLQQSTYSRSIWASYDSQCSGEIANICMHMEYAIHSVYKKEVKESTLACMSRSLATPVKSVISITSREIIL